MTARNEAIGYLDRVRRSNNTARRVVLAPGY
jgi:hypothetical protein